MSSGCAQKNKKVEGELQVVSAVLAVVNAVVIC